MSQVNLMIGNSSSSTLIVDPTQIYAEGSILYPRLIVPFHFHVSPIQIERGLIQNFDILGVHCHLSLNGQKVAIGSVFPMQIRVRYPGLKIPVDVEIPLDNYRLEKVEDRRTGDLKCKIEMSVLYAIYRTIDLEQAGKQMSIEVLSYFDSRNQSLEFEIPQSHWTSKILPKLGYDMVKIIEIPISVPIISGGSKNSATEIEFAQKYFNEGDYDKAVGHCRSALETIRESLSSLKPMIKSDSEYQWAEEIAISTTDWLKKIYDKTYRLTNKPHHPPTIGHFSRHDANAIYLVTLSLVSYISWLDSDE